ncbi:MAG: hypothetical protein JW876_01240 [Candidatus Krumholzibacteriota bacterium]|nr:hypothetical protein [Candidatus Krumholzibacteriota bacterium]
MNDGATWRSRRDRARREIAEAVTCRTGAAREDFLAIFWDNPSPPTIGEFESAFLPDEATRGEILRAVAAATGLDQTAVERCYRREERFPVFAERLLRAGAYAKGDG